MYTKPEVFGQTEKLEKHSAVVPGLLSFALTEVHDKILKKKIKKKRKSQVSQVWPLFQEALCCEVVSAQ